jgi:uncharacterized protein YecE (DUF72 family)
VAGHFPTDGMGLARYAACFDMVEINSSFYRSHRPSTYERWAAITPTRFRFAVKLPRTITHEARLVGATPLARAFRAEVEHLGDKLGPLLVQLPPSLAFDDATAQRFFADLRKFWPETIVCEPRHATWFGDEADHLLAAFYVGRVAADPTRHPLGGIPGGWNGVVYWRLHGSPRMYYSAYGDVALQALATDLRASPAPETWCVFDNTTSGAAAANAIELQAMLRG